MSTKDDETYMNLARHYANESKCSRRKVGAVIVNKGVIVANGHNGVPDELANCSHQDPCFKIANNWPSGKPVPFDSNDCLAIHAEIDAILNAIKRTDKRDRLEGATLYCTHQPCRQCALNIVKVHISKVVYENEYPDNVGVDFLQLAKVKVEKYAPTLVLSEVVTPLFNSNCEAKVHA